MSLRVKQNNEWTNMSEEIQWRQNNEWYRHSSANYPDYYVLNPSDWPMVEMNAVQYIGDGTDQYVVIPEKDTVEQIPTYQAYITMEFPPPRGIATGSAKLRITDYMLYAMYPSASDGQNTIELDYFFTPDVMSMEGMFEGSAYEYLDLSSFDTKKCSNFAYMFYDTQFLKTVDISSFDIEYGDDVSSMFEDSSVETVYVKSQEIADYIDMYGGIPGINFVIGSST